MIKRIFISSLTITIVVLCFIISCQKGASNANNLCDGLITDNTGTNDNAIICIPNVFSPNSDGINDWFKVFYKDIQKTDVKIYDSSNNIVFETTDINAKWIPKDTINTPYLYHYSIQTTTTNNHKTGACGLLYRLNKCLPKYLSISNLQFEDQLTLKYTFTGITSDPIANIQCQ